jgi:hypothetical protein
VAAVEWTLRFEYDRQMSEDLPIGETVDDHGATVHSGPSASWIVWRQDDNGNRFEVARFRERADADAFATTMGARGHKQIYWVAAAE